MICPKCKHSQSGILAECESCGVIFKKYYAALNSRSKSTHPTTKKITKEKLSASTSLKNILFYTKEDGNLFVLAGRAILFAATILWGLKFIFTPIESNYAGESILHLINLPFHEAGHLFFRPFGAFISSLGGSLGQLLMPLICFGVLLIQTRDTFGASVTLWWLGQNFFDLAPYINDARTLSLPLLGGNTGHSSPYGFHDWEYILTESGLLQYDHFLANLSVAVGTSLFLISFTWGGVLLFKQYKSLH